jgi:uncharacterized protein
MMSKAKKHSMKHLVLAAALALGLSTVASAGAADAPAPAPAATPAASAHVPLLWKISDRDNSIYLLGSFHLLKPGDYPLSQDVDAAMQDAKSVMFEIDMDSAMTPTAQAAMMKYQMLGEGRTLSGVLPAETRQKLEAMLKVSGATMAQVDPLDPWALSMGITVGMMQAMGFSAEAGVDKHLSAQAKALGKPVLALETLEGQLKILDAQPMSEQIFGLDQFLSDPKSMATLTQKMHADWMAGNAEALDRDMRAKMQQETPESYRLLLVARNDAWVPQLRALLDDRKAADNTLVVVGALHLLGQDGVIEKLRAKGYRVERVCTACTGAGG